MKNHGPLATVQEGPWSQKKLGSIKNGQVYFFFKSEFPNFDKFRPKSVPLDICLICFIPIEYIRIPKKKLKVFQTLEVKIV